MKRYRNLLVVSCLLLVLAAGIFWTVRYGINPQSSTDQGQDITDEVPSPILPDEDVSSVIGNESAAPDSPIVTDSPLNTASDASDGEEPLVTPSENIPTDAENSDTVPDSTAPPDISSDAPPPNAAGGETVITLNGNTASVVGSGAAVSGRTVNITQGGTYRISGTLANGQIYVAAGGRDTVVLALSGVELSNETQAAIHVQNAGQTRLVLEAGTRNRVQSGTRLPSSTDDSASGGAIYARDDLTITGTGSLEVYGYLNNGIQTTNVLTIDSGTIQVTAANHALKGKDSVVITGGDFALSSMGDGIQSDDTTGAGYGIVSISGGTFQITSDSDGIQAETALSITNGSFTIRTGGGSADVVHTDSGWGWGQPDSGWDLEAEDTGSTKGIKSGGSLTISGGTFTVDSYDDAVHANGNVTITGDRFTLSSGDDGIHADTALSIQGGTITVARSYEGLEGNQITIARGEVNITASDDGINANGGRNPWDRGPSSGTGTMPNLTITGGTIYVNADGDGLDSNGNLTIAGGTVIVDGPSSNWNGAIDSGSENGGVCQVNGGTILAIGSSGMAEGFSSTSTQCSFRHNFETSIPAGSEIVISDAQGNAVFQHTTVKTISSVVFSSPQLTQRETYRLSAGNQSAEIVLTSVYTETGQSNRWGW